MTKTQIYFEDEDLAQLHEISRRTGRSVADLVREAVGRVWLHHDRSGPVALWDGPCAGSSVDHDRIYDDTAGSGTTARGAADGS